MTSERARSSSWETSGRWSAGSTTERVVGDRHHAEGARLASDGAADAAGSDDADSRAPSRAGRSPGPRVAASRRSWSCRASAASDAGPRGSAGWRDRRPRRCSIPARCGRRSRPISGVQIDTVEANGVRHETHAATHRPSAGSRSVVPRAARRRRSEAVTGWLVVGGHDEFDAGVFEQFALEGVVPAPGPERTCRRPRRGWRSIDGNVLSDKFTMCPHIEATKGACCRASTS